MPDLDMVFEVGPALEICLWQNCSGDSKLQFRLPVRAVFSTDFGSIESRGGSAHPNLNFDIKNIGPGGGWNSVRPPGCSTPLSVTTITIMKLHRCMQPARARPTMRAADTVAAGDTVTEQALSTCLDWRLRALR